MFTFCSLLLPSFSPNLFPPGTFPFFVAKVLPPPFNSWRPWRRQRTGTLQAMLAPPPCLVVVVAYSHSPHLLLLEQGGAMVRSWFLLARALPFLVHFPCPVVLPTRLGFNRVSLLVFLHVSHAETRVGWAPWGVYQARQRFLGGVRWTTHPRRIPSKHHLTTHSHQPFQQRLRHHGRVTEAYTPRSCLPWIH